MAAGAQENRWCASPPTHGQRDQDADRPAEATTWVTSQAAWHAGRANAAPSSDSVARRRVVTLGGSLHPRTGSYSSSKAALYSTASSASTIYSSAWAPPT